MYTDIVMFSRSFYRYYYKIYTLILGIKTTIVFSAKIGFSIVLQRKRAFLATAVTFSYSHCIWRQKTVVLGGVIMHKHNIYTFGQVRNEHNDNFE